MKRISSLILIVAAAGAFGTHADELRFPLILSDTTFASDAPSAHVLVKVVRDNAQYRFEKCVVHSLDELGALNTTVFEAVNLAGTKCRALDEAWRSMTDEAANASLTKAVGERLDELARRMNHRAKVWKLIGVVSSAYLAATLPFNRARFGPIARAFVGGAGIYGLTQYLPAYLHYRPFAIDAAVTRQLTSLSPASDELRLTTHHTLVGIAHALEQALVATPSNGALPSVTTNRWVL